MVISMVPFNLVSHPPCVLQRLVSEETSAWRMRRYAFKAYRYRSENGRPGSGSVSVPCETGAD